MLSPLAARADIDDRATAHTARRTTRRHFLWQAAGIAAIGLMPGISRRAFAAAQGNRKLDIVKIDRTTVKVPFREVPARNMDREIPHWRYSEIVEVTLRNGQTGFGETLLYYTWGATEDADVRRALGANAVEIMWDDELGAGLQMALFDAVARSLEVPVHALLGKQVYQRTPLSWWNIDTSPEDMVAECREALKQGYLAYKTKGRPWFDLWAMVEQAAKAVPENFKIDMDFNDTLLTAPKAIPILKELERYPQIGIYESPIFQSDIAGNQAIRAATRVPIAFHYGTPDAKIAITKEVCDGFVIGGGASRILHRGTVSAMADMPFWLQVVGTDISAAWSLHFGGVLSHATWPAVNCHQLFAHRLLTEPIEVAGGTAAVPKRPGLGFELNRDAVEKFRIEKPPARPEPKRLIRTTWPDGRELLISNTGQVNFMLNLFRQDGLPYFERGVHTELVPNDGSQRWHEMYERGLKPKVVKR